MPAGPGKVESPLQVEQGLRGPGAWLLQEGWTLGNRSSSLGPVPSAKPERAETTRL